MTPRKLFALTVAFWALTPATAIAQALCKPEIVISNPRFSDAMNLRRYWTATARVDASSCAGSPGLFAIGFLRLSETAPDLEFTEPFIGHSGETKLRVEFWADEAVARYWIAEVAPCVCRAR